MERKSSDALYLLRAVLELIDKCETLDELREAVRRILNGVKI